jgi:hypothetical protein
MLKRYNYEQLNAEETPMVERYAIVKDPEDELFEDFEIKSKIGSLMFAAVCTRPDIMFAVSYLARFSNHPSREVCQAVIRVFKYLSGTAELGITFRREDGAKPLVYCDSDYGGDANDFKSTSGIAVFIGSTLVCWYSSKQTTTAQSSCDAEIVSMNLASKEIVWVRNLLEEMGFKLHEPTKLMCDNQSAIKLGYNPVFHKRTKHIMIKIAFLVEQLQIDILILEYVKSKENWSDGFTKALARLYFILSRGKYMK